MKKLNIKNYHRGGVRNNNCQQGEINLSEPESCDNCTTDKSVELKYWKFVFWGFILVVLGVMLVMAPSIGTPGDEYLDGLNGKYALAYYTQGDTTFVDYTEDELLKGYPHMKYYGVGFEIWPAVALKYFHLPASAEFPFRHILCVFFGFCVLLFTGLIGKKIGNWKVGTLAVFLITFTPLFFGLSFIASKDIPFAAGFAMANYAFIALCQDIPHYKVRHIIIAVLGIAIAVGVRIGGLMLPLFFVVAFILTVLCEQKSRKALFSQSLKPFWKTIGIGTMIVLVGCLIGLSFYPNFFYAGPINHIKGAFDLVTKFPQRIPFIYDGKLVESTNLPDHYLIYSLIRTLPYFIFVGALLFLVFIVKVCKEYRASNILYLLFAAAFPLIYVIATKANIYTGWRHELFFYPSFIVLVAIGWYELWAVLKRNKWNEKIYGLIVAVIMFVVVSPTLKWMVNNHGYIYSYYNQSVGNPYLKYELDYLEISATKAYEWLRENELNKTDSMVTVSSKIFTPVYYAAMLQDTDHVKVFATSYMGFAETECDYSIINYQIIDPKAIKKFFPPKGTIHVEYVDGNPICAVVKRNKLDSKGIGLIKKGKYEEGIQLLDSAYKYDSDNFGIWFWMGYGYFCTEKYEKSIEFFDKFIGFLPDNDMYALAIAHKGVALYELKRYDEAIPVLQDAEKICQANDLSFVRANLGLTYYYKGEYKTAIPYFEASVSAYPQLQGALSDCRQRI